MVSDWLENIFAENDRYIRRRCKEDPGFKAEIEARRKVSYCRSTHKEWLRDSDVHGTIGWYCARCGAWENYYGAGNRQSESFMTCDELLADKIY